MKYDITDLGFNTWLELYHHLQEAGLADEPRIALEYPADPPDPGTVEIPTVTQRPDVILDMNFIRSQVFGEIYPLLPTVDALHVVLNLAQTHHEPALREFLNKIPTRK